MHAIICQIVFSVCNAIPKYHRFLVVGTWERRNPITTKKDNKRVPRERNNAACPELVERLSILINFDRWHHLKWAIFRAPSRLPCKNDKPAGSGKEFISSYSFQDLWLERTCQTLHSFCNVNHGIRIDEKYKAKVPYATCKCQSQSGNTRVPNKILVQDQQKGVRFRFDISKIGRNNISFSNDSFHVVGNIARKPWADMSDIATHFHCSANCSFQKWDSGICVCANGINAVMTLDQV